MYIQKEFYLREQLKAIHDELGDDADEIELLTEKLKDNLGLKCPHGRPVAIKITRTEIDKWFKRIV